MDIHEYQAKSLLKPFGVPILRGELAYTPREAQRAAVNIGASGSGLCVVKAQILAGGRGKAGGVRIAGGPDEAYHLAAELLGRTLVTPQTGEKGKVVRKVLVEQGAHIAREFYLSFVIDRESATVAIIACAEGGVEIEEVAAHTPHKVLTLRVRPESGLQAFHSRDIAFFFGIAHEQQAKFASVIRALYEAFIGLDCALLEVNPLIATKDGEFYCLDAKLSIDDNALYRQPDACAMLDYDDIDAKEICASQVGINYIALDGNIACMVNGAGLAMATMDVIKQAGGEPANFLDVGGGATPEMVREAFKIILQDSAVHAILVNIFGGIMRCDVIAEGIVGAAKELDVKVPLVVRLEGTNVQLGREILGKSGLKIIAANDMADAARKVVSAANG